MISRLLTVRCVAKADLRYSILSSDLVSSYQWSFCCGLWNPVAAADAVQSSCVHSWRHHNQSIEYYMPTAIISSCMVCVGSGWLMTRQVDKRRSRHPRVERRKWASVRLRSPSWEEPYGQRYSVLENTYPYQSCTWFDNQSAFLCWSVGGNVLDNQLVKRLSGLPGFESNLITEGDAASLSSSLPVNLRKIGLVEHNEALRRVFQIGLILSCQTALSIAILE